MRGHWKLVSCCQFITMFRNVLKLKDAVTPYDLEQSLLRPQHDPLVGEILARLLEPRKFAKKEMSSHSSSALAYLGGEANPPGIEYEEWNKLLAKKFHTWFKQYAKFCTRWLDFNPMEEEAGQSDQQVESAKNSQTVSQIEETKVEVPQVNHPI